MTATAVIQSINPATEELLASYDIFSDAQLERALQQAYDAQRLWRRKPKPDRAEKVQALGRVLRTNKDRYAQLITSEMGKPIVEAEAEIEKCAWNCDFYAEHAASMLAIEPASIGEREGYVQFQPLGVILAIMPWNFPFWQVVRFL